MAERMQNNSLFSQKGDLALEATAIPKPEAAVPDPKGLNLSPAELEARVEDQVSSLNITGFVPALSSAPTIAHEIDAHVRRNARVQREEAEMARQALEQRKLAEYRQTRERVLNAPHAADGTRPPSPRMLMQVMRQMRDRPPPEGPLDYQAAAEAQQYEKYQKAQTMRASLDQVSSHSYSYRRRRCARACPLIALATTHIQRC